MVYKKKCTKCGGIKNKKFFSLNRKSKDGYSFRCKECKKIDKRNYFRTVNGLLCKIYFDQIGNSKKRGHLPPSYSLKEFRGWCKTQSNFNSLYLDWVNSGYNKKHIPSCDRLDDYKSYSLDNIRVTSWDINHKKWCDDARSGINRKISKGVIKCDVNGKILEGYYSLMEASRKTNIPQPNITACCKGRLNNAGGFKWTYNQL